MPTMRARDQGGAELLARVPVRLGEQARVVELVLGVLELALPSGLPLTRIPRISA
jgi:hypothetical protein